MKRSILVSVFVLILCMGTSLFADSLAVMNDLGEVCYNAEGSFEELVVRDVNGDDTVIAAIGDTVDALLGIELGEFYPGYAINDNGVVAFKADIFIDTNDIGDGIFLAGVDYPLTMVTRTGDSVGDFNMGTFEDYVWINDSEQVSFTSAEESSYKTGAFLYTPAFGISSLIVADMNMSGALVEGVCCQVPINDSGHVVVKAWLNDSNTVLNLCRGEGDILQVAMTGDEAPGGFFEEFYKSRLNDNDEILFKADVNGLSKLLLYDGEGFNVVAETGYDAGGDRTFFGLPCHFNLNNAGHVGFRVCFEEDSEETAVYYWDRSTITEIARSGDMYGYTYFYGFKPHVGITEDNTIMFLAKYTEDCADFGVYRWDGVDGIQEIRKVSDMTYRGRITDLAMKGSLFQRSINNNGKIALNVVVEEDYDTPTLTVEPCAFYLPGDVTGDCKIDFTDFAVMAGNWLVDCEADPKNPSCIAR